MNPASAERKEIIGLHRITQKVLRNLCKKHQLYQTPELNDVLYLHYQGFQYIECLEEYTELKCLWLECNAISEIQGLENQTKLKCLFLQNNLIKKIENLEHCRELDTLNLSSNHIRKIDNCGVDVLPVLNTLNLSSNCLRDSESLRGLEECKTLSVLDLANNRIDDILVVKVFAKMPQLRVLVLQGNPVVSKIPQYRKTLILECKELTYLDSRPVFPKDRACAEAWKRGGYNEERKEQERWNRRDRKRIRDSVNATIRMRNKHKSIHEQMDLITSSDSETDEKRRKEAKKQRELSTDHRLMLETGEIVGEEETLLDIWDEVSGPDGIVKKVENENDAEESGSEEAIVAKDPAINVENELTESLEIPERVNVADILKMVEQPMADNNEADDLPELVSEGDACVQKKRSLVEEIGDAPNEVITDETRTKELDLAKYCVLENKDKFLNAAQIGVASKETIINKSHGKKRLLIEEIYDETQPPSYDELYNNLASSEIQTTLTAKEKTNQLVELSEKYMESDDKKPVWVDEIFSQTFMAKPTTTKQEPGVEDTQILSEIEKEIKQGAIKKRRLYSKSTTFTPTSNIDDFFKPIEKTQFPGEFDLNFDELESTGPQSADISDFEDVQNDPTFEEFSEPLLGKTKISEIKKSEFLEFTENSHSFYKLSPKGEEVYASKSNENALLIEEIENDNQVEEKLNAVSVSAEKDIGTKKLLASLVEEIDETTQTCEATGLNINDNCILAEGVRETLFKFDETVQQSRVKSNENCILAESLSESLAEAFDKLSLASENKEQKPKQLHKDYNSSPENVEALQVLLENPLFETLKPTGPMLEAVLETPGEINITITDANQAMKNAIPVNDPEVSKISKNLVSDNLLETGQLKRDDSDSELSNASDDLLSDTSSDNIDSPVSKYDPSKPAYLNKPILEPTTKCAFKYDYKESSSSESEDEMAKSKYNDAANAICDAVMSRVGEHEKPPLERTYFINTAESSEILAENYEPEWEMEKILKRLPDDEAASRAKRLESVDELAQDVVIKTPEQIKYDVECEEVNRQVTEDFEALNANMEYFIYQLQQEQDQIKGELLTKTQEETSELAFDVSKKVNQCGATVFEKIIQTEQITFQQRKASDDIQFNLVYEEKSTLEKTTQLTLVEKDDVITDSEQVFYEAIASDHKTAHPDSFNYYCNKVESNHVDMENAVTEIIPKIDPSETEAIGDERKQEQPISISFQCEATKTTEAKLEYETLETSIENDEMVKACGDHVGIGQTKEKLPFLELEEILERPTMKAYEEEAIELKALLHKLELQNEKLTFVKKSCDELLMYGAHEPSGDENNEDSYHDAEESFEDNTFNDAEGSFDDKIQLANTVSTDESYHDAEEDFGNHKQLVDDVITEIVGDVFDKSLKQEENQKPKNFVITDLESDEEYSYSGPPKPEAPPVKSIQSVLGAFHNLIKDIARRSRAEKQSERKDFEAKRVPTSQTAKLESLQTLLDTPSLLEHHKSSYKELKPQVDAVQKRNTDELKQMVERVYAQKDKYDDSLEVVDGRLVVIKKETGEVEEITATKPTAYGSDESAEEYESAHSSNEAEAEGKESKDLLWDFSMGATKPHTWVPKYRPTMRKSAEQLIINALKRNEETEAEDCDENEVEAGNNVDNSKTLRQFDSKSSIFSNIDEEFFKNLDFKKIAEESSKDENFVEVARSYEELKKIIKHSGTASTRSALTDEEQDIVEMFEQKEEVISMSNSVENELSQAEHVLMHKLVQRTKEAKDRGEELCNTEIKPTEKPYVFDDGKRIIGASCGDNKQDSDSDLDTLVDEVASNKTLAFETESVEFSKNMNVVKMLKKLQIDDPIAQDLLKDKKPTDFGDFTSPLELNFEEISLGEERCGVAETAQEIYAKKLAEYAKFKMDKQLSIPSSEVAIQCEPSSFDEASNVKIMHSQSSKTELQVLSTQSNTEIEIAGSSVDTDYNTINNTTEQLA